MFKAGKTSLEWGSLSQEMHSLINDENRTCDKMIKSSANILWGRN